MRADYGENRISFRLAFRPFVDAFQFRGRSTRTEVVSFWLLGLFSGMVHLVELEPSAIARLAGWIWTVLWQWPWIPLLVRRLHDQDKSGRLALIALVPVIITELGLFFGHEATGTGFHISTDLGFIRESKELAWTPLTIVGAVVFLYAALMALIFYVLPGTDGPNRFGPDPRNQTAPPPLPAETIR
jgi:uncharacterized membrane protein YhaH (DUF805 family)